MDEKKTERNVVTLRPLEVADFRNKMLKQQKGTCFLCKKDIQQDQAALDHDHTTGRCRSTLHRNCNSVEGRVLSWIKRSGVEPIVFLRNLLLYWEADYNHMPVHPNHKTEKQKTILKLKRRIKKAKRVSTKARLKQEIQELINSEDGV